MRAARNSMNEHVTHLINWSAISMAIASWLHFAPDVAGLLSAIWIGLQLFANAPNLFKRGCVNVKLFIEWLTKK